MCILRASQALEAQKASLNYSDHANFENSEGRPNARVTDNDTEPQRYANYMLFFVYYMYIVYFVYNNVYIICLVCVSYVYYMYMRCILYVYFVYICILYV